MSFQNFQCGYPEHAPGKGELLQSRGADCSLGLCAYYARGVASGNISKVMAGNVARSPGVQRARCDELLKWTQNRLADCITHANMTAWSANQ